MQRHFFNGGVLTPGMAQERFRKRMGEISLAIVAESARWGDSKRTTPFTRNDWTNACDWVLNTHMPVRTAIVLQQFRNQGWFPDTDAPSFSRHGGVVQSGFPLGLGATAGTVYYTTDGSDPRRVGGSINPAAAVYEVAARTNTLVAAGSVWRYLDDGSGQETAWRDPGFDDSGWDSGPAQLGYGNNGEVTTVSYGPDSGNKYITTYYRHTFVVDSVTGVTQVVLGLVRDDGAVIYLNGKEVVRDNMPGGSITNSTTASGVVGGGNETHFFEHALDPADLEPGTNVLAVEVHQVGATSSDTSFDLRLSAVSSGTPSNLVLTRSRTVKSRAYDNGEWSALTEAFFAVGSAVDQVRITELMFNPDNPPDGSPHGASDFEFIELKNIGDAPVDLSRVAFSDGVDVTMTNALLLPGELAVVVSDLAAFASRYDTNGIVIAGVYTGRLDNGGEQLALVDPFDSIVHDFRYDDDWHKAADGEGRSLVIIDGGAPVETWGNSNGWRVSAIQHGTPGWEESTLSEGDIVINEILTHTDATTDWIELHNTTSDDVDIGGWLLSDDPTHLAKFEIPAGTILRGRGYAVFTAGDHFSNPAHPGSHEVFAFSELGENAALASGVAGIPTGYRVVETFGASDREVTMGRHVRSDGEMDFVALAYETPNVSNAPPRVGPVVVNEIMYHPADGEYEFIELRNLAATNVPLCDPSVPTNTWRFSGALSFAFPEGAAVAGDGYAVIVPTLPAVFRQRYGVPTNVPVYGPCTGSLENAGESIKLRKPGTPEPDGYVPYILADRVKYDDELPWPLEADGLGPALRKVAPSLYGNDPANWTVSAHNDGSPGEGEIRVPRRWLIAHGWTNDLSAAERSDTDGDGMTAMEEFIADTVPTNADSALRLLLEPDGVSSSYRLRWNGSTNRYYTVELFSGLGDRPQPEPGFDHLRGTLTQMTYRVTATNATRFYRLRVELK